MGGSLLPFLGLAIVVIATPGQDTALIIRNTLAGGRSSGFATSFGITCGLLMWTTVAAVGLTAMLIASEPVFVALKVVGGASALPPFAGFLLLGAIFSSLTLVWLCGYAVVVERAGDRLRRGSTRRALDAIAGVILVALGIRVATEPA